MKPPLFVRPLSQQERQARDAGCRCRDAFTLRRSQIILASAQRQRASQIACHLHCSRQTVRNAIHGFNSKGLDCLKPQSSRPKSVYPLLDEVKLSQLKVLLHTNPRNLGKKRSTWTLGLLVEVCVEQGITEQPVSRETLRQALVRLEVSWKRAKNWISSPDPQYQLKKSQRERFLRLAESNPDWVERFFG